MVGRRVLLRVEKGPAKPGDKVLEVEHLTVKDGRGVTMVDDVSFDVRAGEIVGIAGVAGNGQSELLEAIAGIRRDRNPATSSCSAASRSLSPEATIRRKLRAMGPGPCAGGPPAHGPGPAVRGERERHPRLSGRPNLSEAARSSISRRSATTPRRASRNTTSARPNCRPEDREFLRRQPAEDRAGAREMERDPEVLLVGQPTRGVDIGAIEFIHKPAHRHARRRQGDPARSRSSSTRSARSPTASS